MPKPSPSLQQLKHRIDQTYHRLKAYAKPNSHPQSQPSLSLSHSPSPSSPPTVFTQEMRRCKEHGMEPKYYCKDCKRAGFCLKCISGGNHAQHQVVEIELCGHHLLTNLYELHQEVNVRFDFLKAKEITLTQEMNKLDTVHEQVQKEIKSTFQKVRQVIKQSETALLESVTNKKKTSMDGIQRQLIQFNTQLSNYARGAERLNKLMKGGSQAQLIQQFIEVEDELSPLMRKSGKASLYKELEQRLFSMRNQQFFQIVLKQLTSLDEGVCSLVGPKPSLAQRSAQTQSLQANPSQAFSHSDRSLNLLRERQEGSAEKEKTVRHGVSVEERMSEIRLRINDIFKRGANKGNQSSSRKWTYSPSGDRLEMSVKDKSPHRMERVDKVWDKYMGKLNQQRQKLYGRNKVV